MPLVDRTFLAIRESRLDEESILNLGRIVYLGIVKPEGVTEEMLLNWQVPLAEMIAAALVVAAQANMKAAPPGEATGEKVPLSTSTN